MDRCWQVDFFRPRLCGGFAFYTYQLALGFSFRYWRCIKTPSLRLHIGPIKLWLGFRLGDWGGTQEFRRIGEARMECPYCGEDCWHDEYRDLIGDVAAQDGLENDSWMSWTCRHCDKDFWARMAIGVHLKATKDKPPA